MTKNTIPLLAIALLVSAGTACCNAAQAADPLLDQLKSYNYSPQSQLPDAIAALVSSVRSEPAKREAVAGGLAAVLSSNASFDAKQLACRQLVFVAGQNQIPALIGMIKDDNLCHYALMALARIPGRAVNDSLIAHLTESQGRNRLELLSLLADRNDDRSIANLTDFLNESESPATLASAAASLARLNGPAASGTLAAEYKSGTATARKAIGPAIVQNAENALRRGDTTTAAMLFKLCALPDSDPVLRAAALRGLVSVEPDLAAARVLSALKEDGTPRQSMAADLVRNLPAALVAGPLSSALPNLTAHGQLLLLTAIEERGERGPWPGVIAITHSANPAVRLAAHEALGKIGDYQSLPALLNAAMNGSAAEKEVARASITRLRGKRVDQSLRSLLMSKNPPAGLLVETINAIAHRGRNEAMDAWMELYMMSAEKSPAIRNAAFAAMRDTGNAPMLDMVLIRAVKLPVDDRDAAIEAASEIARRGKAETERTGPILKVLGTASKPADKLTLLTILNQVGGPRALQAISKAVSDPSAEVRIGALALLAEWPTDEPMEQLLRIAKTSADARGRTIALHGYLRMIGTNELRSPAQTLELYRNVAASVTRADDKRQVLAGIAKVRTLGALQLAASYLNDADVQSEAQSAVMTIGRATIGAFPDETRNTLSILSKSAPDGDVGKHASEILALPVKAGDFDIAWEVSPAYQQPGADYKALFDIKFTPELSGGAGSTPWQLMPPVTDPEHPYLLDLLALFGGEQKVAYLATAVKSETARDLNIEMGSDDGIKAWLNGQVVLSNNTARAAAPGEEKITVHLKAGWNVLMLKITQNNMGWGACARFTEISGGPATGLTYSVPSAISK